MDTYNFDAKKVKADIVKWIKEYFDESGKDCKAIVGISGGKDSSVVAALCVEALGKDRVIGVLMPQGEQSDIEYSKMLCQYLDIKNYTINIGEPTGDILSLIEKSIGECSLDTKINLPARIRMSILYGVSQTVHGRVANTCNLSEDWIGYSTRYGDSVGDFSPLSNLTVTEVKLLGKELKLPYWFVEKTPTDGLSGKTDEENIGYSYEVLDKYIRTGVIDDLELKKKIDDRHQKNLFKLELMPSFKYGKEN